MGDGLETSLLRDIIKPINRALAIDNTGNK